MALFGAVSSKQVDEFAKELAQELFRPDRLSLALLGPYTDPQPFATLLESL